MPPPLYPQQTPTLSGSIAVAPTLTPTPTLEPRQENYYITLSITRDTTTYTTTILLGGPAATEPSSLEVPATGVVTPAATPSSTEPSSALPQTATDPSQAATIGALVGSIVASFALVCILFACFFYTGSSAGTEKSSSGPSSSGGGSSRRSGRGRSRMVPPIGIERVVRVQSVERVSPAVQAAALQGDRFFGFARIPPLSG